MDAGPEQGGIRGTTTVAERAWMRREGGLWLIRVEGKACAFWARSLCPNEGQVIWAQCRGKGFGTPGLPRRPPCLGPASPGKTSGASRAHSVSR